MSEQTFFNLIPSINTSHAFHYFEVVSGNGSGEKNKVALTLEQTVKLLTCGYSVTYVKPLDNEQYNIFRFQAIMYFI